MSDNLSEPYVSTSLDSGVARVTFFSPKANSLNSDLLEKIACELKALSSKENVKVCLLKSAGKSAFCAGASLSELKQLENEKEAEVLFSGFGRVMMTLIGMPQFVVCRVQGRAVGGGLGLIAACDYTIANNSASVKLSELELGGGPFVIGPFLRRKMGQSAYSQMVIDRLWHNPTWALEKGLYSQVVEDESSGVMDSVVGKLLKELSDKPLEVMQSIKQQMWDGFQYSAADLAKYSKLSAKFFLKKRDKNA